MKNERARTHYDNAVVLLTHACQTEDAQQTFMLGYLADVSLRAAQFCVDNHALVAGIDEDLVSHSTQQPNSAPVWGGPPLPAHIAAVQQGGTPS